jgi:hypothetical protein
MSEAYRSSVRLYWMAKETDEPNRAFNVESQRLSVHDNYHNCLRILAIYSRTHRGSIVAHGIWGGRKILGLKFQDKNVTIGIVEGGRIERGITHEIKNPYDLRRYLENTVGFTVANLNEQTFEKALEQLKKIESEKNIKISPEETKRW